MAPINLPDGTEVSEVILPDGATASEVIAPDGSTVFGGIPDSVVDRPADDSSSSGTPDQHGVEISVSQDWSKIQARISANADNFDDAHLYASDGTELVAVDVSGNTAGDIITFETSGTLLNADNNYFIELGDDDGIYTIGFLQSPSFPYTSDGNLEIVGGTVNVGSSSSTANNWDKIGNINF